MVEPQLPVRHPGFNPCSFHKATICHVKHVASKLVAEGETIPGDVWRDQAGRDSGHFFLYSIGQNVVQGQPLPSLVMNEVA